MVSGNVKYNNTDMIMIVLEKQSVISHFQHTPTIGPIFLRKF